MAKKLFIQTHGCQMNEYDSSRLVDLLGANSGYELTTSEEEADLLLLNTCSIREKAQEKVFHQLGRWKALKAERKGVQIAVGGCVASQEGDALTARAPFVDVVFGPQTLHRVPNLLERKGDIALVDVTFPEIEKFDVLPAPSVNGPSAFVSIMEGCSKYCSFCVVPYTRGEEVSRPVGDVIAEIVSLAEQGVREVNLLGQNVNSYVGAMDDGEAVDLAFVITVIAQIDGIDRIRYTTSHPNDFTDNLIEVYAEVPELVSHLHLPVQSGSDRILMAMKRGHTAADYIRKIERLREVRPEISLSSDFIVGFPGETAEDFDATMELIDTIGYDHSFSFIYSARPGTPAAALLDETSEALKKERLQRLQARISEQAMEISQAMVGSMQRVLVTGLSKRDDTQLQARTENNRVVNLTGPRELIGGFADVRVTEALPNSLRGTLQVAN